MTQKSIWNILGGLTLAIILSGFIAVPINLPLMAAATATPTPTPSVGITALSACASDAPLSLVYLPNSSFISNIQTLPDGSFLLQGSMDNMNGIWLARMNTAGDLLWQNLFSGNPDNVRLGANGSIVLEYRTVSLEIDLDGKVVRALNVPWYQPNIDGSFTIINGSNVARFHDPQNPLWQVQVKDFGGLNTYTSDGGALLAYAGVYVDRSVYYAPQYTDIKVIKVMPDGQVFQRVFGKLVGDETLDFLQSTGDGGALLAGMHAYEELGSDYDIWLMKVNASGGMSWQATLKLAPNFETLQKIHVLNNGYLVEAANMSTNQHYLVMLNPGGGLRWQKIITSVRGEVEITTAASSAEGSLLLAGETWEKTTVYWLAKLDTKGSLAWEKTIGFELPGAPGGEVLSILPLADRQILLGGLTNQSGNQLAQEYSAWIAQIPDAGQTLGLIQLLPARFSIITTLGSRPNNLPDEIVTGAGIELKDVKYSVTETKLTSVAACLPADVVYPTPAALPTLTPSVTPTLALSRNLYLTDPPMEGNDVLLLQQRLYELGYTEVGARDGIFGRMTSTAVRNFQQCNNLEVDGYVGPKTWTQLFSSSAVGAR
jgi:hypothetical protein